MKKLILLATLLSGCSGQIVCEWQTENEQFEELIEKTIEKLDEKE